MSPVLKILPPVWFFALLMLGALAHYLAPSVHVFYYPLPVLGVAILVFGFALSMYASSLFAKEGTEILPTSPANKKLVTHGPFKFTRNPMYLGMVLGLLGVALALGSLAPYLAALADFIVLNFFFIPFEEAKMLRQFGESYRTYLKTVRRWA